MDMRFILAKKNWKQTCFLFLAFVLLIGNSRALSQEKPPVTFGKVAPSDFNLPKSKVIDSNSSAVIIADVGNTSFIGNKNGWVSYVYKRRTRIKIIDKRAFDAATVRVALYKDGDDEEKLDNIEGGTYNLENGKIIETRLEKKDIFKDKKDKNIVEEKFTMPAVTEGSIIEYSYTLTSDFDFNLPHWEFQNIKYPSLWSEYEVSIPSLLTYIFLKQGPHPFYIDKTTEGHQNYLLSEKHTGDLLTNEQNFTVNANIIKRRWVMKDVPDFDVENYIFTPDNYIDKIEFQLSKIYNGESTRDVLNNWNKATEELLEAKDFGLPLKTDYVEFSTEVHNIIGNETGMLEKAKKIYYFIQNNVTCTNHYGKYIMTSLKEILKKRNGNVGEVNLLLASMLRQAQIHADPVLMSTREFGLNSSSYPILQRLNYVVCRVAIDNHVYYLDASLPFLGFGRLAENCYNGHARVICETDSGAVFFWTDSIKESKISSVFILNSEKGGGMMAGSMESTLGYCESTEMREKINEKGEKEFLRSLQGSYGSDMKLENFGIDSLKQNEQPVKMHFDLSFKNNPEDDIIYFNPMMGESYKENPFKASERKYPVEMPYRIDETYILNMDIPAGYVVDELPKSAKVAYNDNEGFFEYLIQKDENGVQLRSHIKLNKALFEAEEYNSLRDFFAYVVKKQSEQIVFKKKK